MMKMNRFLFTTAALCLLVSIAQAETTGINMSVGSMILLKKTDRYGAMVPTEIDLTNNSVAFDWYFLPRAKKVFKESEVQSGYNIVYFEQGKANISFAIFSLVAEKAAGGQVLLRSATKPGLYSKNIYFCYSHVGSINSVDVSDPSYQFALLPGPPRDVPFDTSTVLSPTPRPESVFYPATGTVIDEATPTFKWPPSKRAVAYRVQVAVLRPGLFGKQIFPIAEARRVEGTSISYLDMKPIEYETKEVSPMLDIDGILSEHEPDQILEPFTGQLDKPAELVTGRLYGWKVSPIKEGQSVMDFNFDFTGQKESLYDLWLEFKVGKDSGETEESETTE